MTQEITLLIGVAAIFLVLIMPLITLVSLMKRQDFPQPTDKVAWVLVVLLLPVFGWILYAVNGKSA